MAREAARAHHAAQSVGRLRNEHPFAASRLYGLTLRHVDLDLDARIPESAGEKFFEPVGLEEVHAGPRARDVVDEEGDVAADVRDLSAVDIPDPLDAFE